MDPVSLDISSKSSISEKWCEALSGTEPFCKKSRPKVATKNFELLYCHPDLVHHLPALPFQTPGADTGGPSES